MSIPIIIPITYEERLTVIMELNPTYAIEIVMFMETNPEFLQISHLISLTELPIGFNLNSNEPYRSDAPEGVFEHLIYYIANAGVNANYSHKQWKKIQNYIRTHKSLKDLTTTLSIQPKKIQVYHDLYHLLIKYNINSYDLNIDQALQLCQELKGVGDGCVTHLQTIFNKPITLPNYTDIGFKKGFMKFYNLDKKPTKKQVFEKSKDWSNMKIANSLMQQAYLYL
jgi:hypothetical protein